jgi:hypothetical protein
MKKLWISILTTTCLFACLSFTACSPEVGSDEWCEKMKEKPKSEWTADEAKDYAKHCLFK